MRFFINRTGLLNRTKCPTNVVPVSQTSEITEVDTSDYLRYIS